LPQTDGHWCQPVAYCGLLTAKHLPARMLLVLPFSFNSPSHSTPLSLQAPYNFYLFIYFLIKHLYHPYNFHVVSEYKNIKKTRPKFCFPN
jgi:hypothetical protein